MNSVFQADTVAALRTRIEQLTPESKPLWGTMDVAKMLAHCNVTYELVYEAGRKRPPFFVRLLLRVLVKPIIVNEKPFKINSQTGPDFIIKSDRDFGTEKARLLAYIEQTRELGEASFEGRESHNFGVLTAREWNNMFWKHLDHHLRQFGL
jgi:hypothetical protein